LFTSNGLHGISYISEDITLYNNRCENLEPYKVNLLKVQPGKDKYGRKEFRWVVPSRRRLIDLVQWVCHILLTANGLFKLYMLPVAIDQTFNCHSVQISHVKTILGLWYAVEYGEIK
jgi:hypothetical protein